MNGNLIDVDELLRVVEAIFRSGATIQSVAVTPRPPAPA